MIYTVKYTVYFSYGNSGTFKGIKTARKAIMTSGFAMWNRVNIFEGSKVVGYVYNGVGNVYCYHDLEKIKTYTLRKDGSLGDFVGYAMA